MLFDAPRAACSTVMPLGAADPAASEGTAETVVVWFYGSESTAHLAQSRAGRADGAFFLDSSEHHLSRRNRAPPLPVERAARQEERLRHVVAALVVHGRP